jgi:ankyrin repeat protein
MTAAIKNSLAIARELVQRGAAMEKQDRYGATALMLACGEGSKTTSEFLLGAGAKTDTHDTGGQNVLAYAVNGCQPGLCALALSRGADPNEPQPATSMTALHLAAKKPCPTAIRELLAAGARIEERDKQGNTPLDLARLSGDPESIELLGGAKSR